MHIELAVHTYTKLNSDTVHSIIYKAFNGERGHGKNH